jgi:hypothetical protein
MLSKNTTIISILDNLDTNLYNKNKIKSGI